MMTAGPGQDVGGLQNIFFFKKKRIDYFQWIGGISKICYVTKIVMFLSAGIRER